MQNLNNSNKGIFLNGKQQIINLFRHLSEKEKNNILKYIQVKNPSLARELSESSFTFRDLLDLPPHDLSKIFAKVPATVIGLSIYDQDDIVKKNVLRTLPRNKAEEAFEIINQSINNPKSYITKAQAKVMKTAITLARANLITIH